MGRESLEERVIRKLGPSCRSEEVPRNIVGRHIVVQEERRLAVDRSQRWIWPGLMLMNANVILHRGVHG
jgi:hypothetical protein